MYALGLQTVDAVTRGLLWRLLAFNSTRISTQTVRHESTYIIIFLTRHNKSVIDDEYDVKSDI